LRGAREAFGLEPPPQLLEGEAKRPGAARLELADDQLEVAARRVDRKLA